MGPAGPGTGKMYNAGLMRILHLSEGQGWSGGTAQLVALAKGLRGRGHENLVGCPPGGEHERRLAEEGIAHFAFAPFQDYDLAAAWRLRAVARSFRPEVVHAHHSRAHAVALACQHLLAPGERSALVVTRRVSFPIRGNPFSAYKYRSPLVDGYIAVAESIRRRLLGGGVPAGRVVTIPSGTDVSAYAPMPPSERVRRELGLKPGTPVVTMIANYSPWKGQTVFLRAAGELLARGVPAVFILAGLATDSRDLSAFASEAGVSMACAFLLGFRTDVKDLLSVTDVSVNAAVDGEGISGALRESLAMGVPVVASDAGGNAELVHDGETGELFPAGDWKALADLIENLLRDREFALREAAAGRALVRDSFSTEHMVAATLRLYGRILDARSRA